MTVVVWLDVLRVHVVLFAVDCQQFSKAAMKFNVRYRFAWLGSIALLSLMTTSIASAKSPKYIRAQVHFLATSTSTRSSFGDNYDNYLIAIKTVDGSGPELARLEDIYPPYQSALPEKILKSSGSVKLKVKRDRSCDVAYGDMPLRTAPGDPAAILPERLGYHPLLAKVPDAKVVLSCFRVVR